MKMSEEKMRNGAQSAPAGETAETQSAPEEDVAAEITPAGTPAEGETASLPLSKKQQKNTGIFLGIATMCFLVYLACYAAKSLLSVNTPAMIEEGYSSVAIGTMTSVYFFLYGAGQLFVGFIGDKVKLKYMLLGGLLVAAASCFLFALIDSVVLKTVVWGACGFGLSFLYAPLVRSVSDHLEGRQAEICMFLLDFASIIGSTVAGVSGALGNWKTATIVFASLLAFLAAASFVFNAVFDKVCAGREEKRRAAAEKPQAMPLKAFAGYWLRTGGVVFILVTAIQGIAKNSITFWIPTYISQYLEFSPETASIIFSVMSLAAAFNQLVAIFLYHLMKNRAIRVVRFSFALSAVCFLLLIPIRNAWANLVVLLVAQSGYSWAGTMIWTYYCRSYVGAGRVAFVVGFLDFCSYLFAAIGSVLFSDAIAAIGWTRLIVVWGGLMASGVRAAFLFPKSTKNI